MNDIEAQLPAPSNRRLKLSIIIMPASISKEAAMPAWGESTQKPAVF